MESSLLAASASPSFSSASLPTYSFTWSRRIRNCPTRRLSPSHATDNLATQGDMLGAWDPFKRRLSSRSNPEREDQLCSNCEALQLRSLLKYGADVRRNSISSSLPFGDVKSQKKSCGLCSLILEGALAVLESKHERFVDKKVLSIRTRSHAKHQLKITVSGTYRLPLDLKGRIGEAYSQEPFTEHFYLQQMPPGLLTDDENSQLIDERPIDFEEVKRWLSTCHHDHGVECDSASKYGFVHRPQWLTVVDVIDKHLVELPPDSPYAALSYVWGGVQLVHLNSNNKDSLMKTNGLLSPEYVDSIPATIWDAMDVAKQIGLRYIWIDSLCIQQDDALAIQHQVTHMHNIFGSAYVTLIAADGTSASSGLYGTAFRPRQVRYGLKVIEDEDEKPISRLIGPGMFLSLVSLQHDGPPQPDCWDITQKNSAALPVSTAVEKTVWNSRAWTYQEAQLSSRTLVFVDQQVFYHCNQAVWSEHLLGRKANNRGHAIDKRYTRLGNLTSNPHFTKSWDQHDASIEVKRDGRTIVVSSEAFLLYKDLVIAYTPRDMGNIYDKLAAFDGIAKVLERCLDSDLLYGLPESLLDLALLWHPKTSLTKVTGPGFPSWSWAGWKGAVEYAAQHGVSEGATRILYDDESKPERVRPLNRWYKATDDGGFEPINILGCGIKEAISEEDGNLPDGWKGFLAPNTERNIDIDDKAPSPALLRCYTMKSRLIIEDDKLYSPDGRKRVIGQFSWDEEQSPVEAKDLAEQVGQYHLGGSRNTTKATTVDFIALSETQFFREEKLNTGLIGNLYRHPHEYYLYNVMAVEWVEDAVGGKTALRRGLGRVFQDEWEKSVPEYLWLNLG